MFLKDSIGVSIGEHFYSHHSIKILCYTCQVASNNQYHSQNLYVIDNLDIEVRHEILRVIDILIIA